MRGAIDLTLVAGELLALRGIGERRRRTDRLGSGAARSAYAETVFDAMIVALSGRIHLDETADATPGDGAARDLGGPLHPRPGRGGARLKSRRRPTPRCAGPAAGPPPRAERRCGAAEDSSTRSRTLFEPASGGGWRGRARRRRERPHGRRGAGSEAGWHRARCHRANEAGTAGRPSPGRRAATRRPLARGPGRSRLGWRFRARAATRPRAAAPASWSASATGAARTTSTSTRRSRTSSSIRCPRTTTSSSASGYAPAARSCCWSTCPARCAASG